MSTIQKIGWPISTADNSATIPALYQVFTPDRNFQLSGAVFGLFIYNAPVFTSITAELWSYNGTAAIKKIADATNSHTTAAISTALGSLNHGWLQVGFTFNGVGLRDSSSYAIAPRLVGYTGTEASHVAIALGYPDPPNITGITVSTNDADNTPFEVSLVGAEL